MVTGIKWVKYAFNFLEFFLLIIFYVTFKISLSTHAYIVYMNTHNAYTFIRCLRPTELTFYQNFPKIKRKASEYMFHTGIKLGIRNIKYNMYICPGKCLIYYGWDTIILIIMLVLKYSKLSADKEEIIAFWTKEGVWLIIKEILPWK